MTKKSKVLLAAAACAMVALVPLIVAVRIYVEHQQKVNLTEDMLFSEV